MRKSGSVSPLQCPTLYDPQFLCPWNSPGKNTEVGSHSLLQGIFPTQGLNLGSLALQADSLLCEIYPQSYTDFSILCYLNCIHVHPSPQRINSCLSFPFQRIFTIHVAEFWKSSSKRRNTKSVQFSSVAQSCPTLCDPMNCSTPCLPVHHQLLEFTQTHVH